MALSLWAKSAVGTNLSFIKGLGKAAKSWREILQQTLSRKVPKTQVHPQRVDALQGDRYFQQTRFIQAKSGDSLISRVFRSLISSSTAKLWSRDLTRRILMTSRGARSIPLFSLVGITLGIDVETLMESGNQSIITGIKESFDGYSWVPESLEKTPRCLSDLHINKDKFLAKGCEGVVYEAKVKVDSGSLSDGHPESYDLAVKAVFNYGAESNATSIMNGLGREMVPLQSSAKTETEAEDCDDDMLQPSTNRLPPHPNIVEMPGMFVDDFLVTEEGLRKFPAALPHSHNPSQCFGRNKTMYLVMKKRSNDLRSYLTGNPNISMATRCFLLAQLLEGVAHLRKHGVAHRDLKSNNLLVDEAGSAAWPRLEICDFGCCMAEQDKKMQILFPSLDLFQGGNDWLKAPEIATAVPGHGKFLNFEKSDLWAVGAIAYEILGVSNPFYPTSPECPTHRLKNTSYQTSQLPSLPDEVPGAIKQLVISLLDRDPMKRPSADVAATVVQMVLLSSRKNGHKQMRKSLFRSATRPRYVVQSGQRAGRRHLLPPTKEELMFQKILSQSLALYSYLTLKKPSDKQSMDLVSTFVFLSRLTYSDFKASLKFF